MFSFFILDVFMNYGLQIIIIELGIIELQIIYYRVINYNHSIITNYTNIWQVLKEYSLYFVYIEAQEQGSVYSTGVAHHRLQRIIIILIFKILLL
jgi:hypothetical protein